MDFEQDYIMRQIKQMIQVLAKIIFNKKEEMEIEESAIIATGTDGDQIDLFALADSGRINEAENLLYEYLDTSDLSQLKNAFSFYEHLNTYQNEFLEEHDYSREEIMDGIKNISAQFGVAGLADTLL